VDRFNVHQAHAQNARHEAAEASDAARRSPHAGASVVAVQDKHRHGHGQRRHGHDHAQPTYERDVLRGGRHVLRHEQHEDGEGEQHREAQGDLLARLGRQQEACQRQTRQHHARDDHVQEVVEHSTPDL
ncbi:hypothetical protein EGW08_005786, partial [Elysia chlorotica]